jgi:hypothetical protein
VAKIKYFGTRVTKLHSWRNLEHIKFGECLIPFCLVFCLPTSSLNT